MSKETARPARWQLDDRTLDQALSVATVTCSAPAFTGYTMIGTARDDLAPAQSSTIRQFVERSAAIARKAQLATAATAIAVSTLFSLATSATAATSAQPDQDRPAFDGAARINPPLAVPADAELGSRSTIRPSRGDRGMLTASLDAIEPGSPGDPLSRSLPAAAKKGVITDIDAGSRIGLGFAKPKSLGRLAEDLPAKRSSGKQAANTRYAALGRPERSANKAVSSSRLDGRIATSGHATACLPPDLKRVLNEVVANFGPIRINSTSRSHSHNARVGGAKRSMHLECRAIDFAYHGSRRGKLISFLRNHGDVGGLGNYGHGGHIHIDDGPRRSW